MEFVKKTGPVLAVIFISLGLLYWQPRWATGVAVAICTVFFVSFAHTLLPGRQPLISQLATRFHGGLSPQSVVYTRIITLVWTIFFGLLIVELSLLAWLTPGRYYLLIANAINLVSAAGLFLLEFRLRRWFVTDIEHASFKDYIGFLTRNGIRTVKPE